MKIKTRCPWPSDDKLMIKYHDKEWGVPLHIQAGLSWRTILHKRENFRKAFDKFDYNKVAKYDSRKINSLLKDAGIVRNKLKVEGAVLNAKAFLKVRKEFGTFDKYIWSFVGGKPIQNNFRSLKELPARTVQITKRASGKNRTIR